ncbi:MAG: Crp/Fnr family transcriptional regulator [Akkermansiaceae bacterium]
MSDKLTRPELPSVGIVEEMDDDDRRLLSDYGEFLPAQAGQTVIETNEDQPYLYLVISGLLHVSIQVEGRAKLVARVEKGETLGEVNAFDPAKASATVTAQEFTQIWRANKADIDEFVAAYPAAGAKLLSGVITVMCRRIRQMNQKLAESETMEVLGKCW